MATAIYGLIIAIGFLLLIINKEFLLYYFIFLYPILPEYLAVSFSQSLPLMTASRMLLIVMMIGVLLSGKISLTTLKKTKYWKILLFFVICEGAVCIAHIQDIDSLKYYIGVILENFIFLIVITNFIDTRKKLNKCINVLVFAAGFVFLMGSLEPITKINLASTFLNTGSRETILMSAYERFSSIRAAFSFGHSIALGVYCLAIMPFILYKINTTNKIIYYILFELGLCCMLMTMSRGVILVFFGVFLLSLIRLRSNEVAGYYKVIAITLFSAVLVILAVPSIYNIINDTILGSINALSSNVTSSVSTGNDDAVSSRLCQLTMIPQVFCKYPIFGGGAGYIFKNTVYVYLEKRSFIACSIDIEYLSMLINRGIVGLVAGLTTYLGILRRCWVAMRRAKENLLSKAFFLSFISIFLAYFTVAQLTTNKILWLLIGLALCQIRNDMTEKSDL